MFIWEGSGNTKWVVMVLFLPFTWWVRWMGLVVKVVFDGDT